MWDRQKAVEYLNSNAEDGSIGRCAEYTRRAIKAGGALVVRHGLAKDYGSSLRAVGFQPLGENPPGGFLAGDVVIIEALDESHPEGHMAMFNGESWVSDFTQNGLYPGPRYRKQKPGYEIYRYGYKWDAVGSSWSSNRT